MSRRRPTGSTQPSWSCLHSQGATYAGRWLRSAHAGEVELEGQREPYAPGKARRNRSTEPSGSLWRHVASRLLTAAQR